LEKLPVKILIIRAFKRKKSSRRQAMTKKLILLLCIAVLSILVLAGCAPGPNPAVDVPDNQGKSAGFWSGLWQGIISPVTFFISLFTDNVNIYEVYNNGNWYDFGFMFGISIILGGGAGGARWKSK
jgi:hypothetical protein